ncbi:MAG: 3-deoxy-7-phosphoheptulonate synthase, partial [Candidatus Marinimicrobia bacterium]|nr:3-deoxy-7-phosphoheptulonate synthase [Candidatus Neomarinimicrobiota bacterium]
RGIRTVETYTRNTLDLSIVPSIREVTHLPVIVDPSHATGRLGLIKPMSLAAVAAGVDGLIIEVHYKPETALSDRDQQLNPEQFKKLMHEVMSLKNFMQTLNSQTDADHSN